MNGRWLSHVFFVLGFTLAGCPGRLENPERFLTPTCRLSIDVPRDILANRCGMSGCHSGLFPAGGLDLALAGVSTRLRRVPAAGCPGRQLIVPGDSRRSYLVEKLHPRPECGSQMPLGAPPLNNLEIECVAAWVESLEVDAGIDSATDTAVDTNDVLHDTVSDHVDDSASDGGLDVSTDVGTDVGTDATLDDSDAPTDVESP